MATIVDATCSITEASCQPEKEDGTVSLATSSKRNETLSPNQNHPTNTDSWNGSLPVAVPTNPAGPGFHYVESSTTDSGVSNPSSVTSDGIPITQCTAGEPSTELQLELRTVERALRSSGIEDVGECERGACVSAHPGTGLGGEEGRRREEGGETEYGELSGGPTQGEGEEEDGGSSCSFSLDSSDTRPEPTPDHLSEVASCSEEGSTTSSSIDTQSHSGTFSPDSTTLSNHPRRGSLGWGSRGLKSVFNRGSKNKLSYVGSVDARSRGIIAASSTTGLILQGRPSALPAKSAAEEKRHQKLYEEMVTAARRKELQRAKEVMQKEKQKHQRDKMVNDSLREWQRVLPNWENMKSSRRVRELWWLGLPPGVRGQVWKRAIGNDLNISPELYQICLTRCQEKLSNTKRRSRSGSPGSLKGISREQSVEVIHLDVLRTFPTLGFFQEGGPYNQMLHDVLGAYACYRPDVGYVQGMSFLAAVLLLNMEASDAFIYLANLLNRSSYLAFFRVDHDLMLPYFTTFTTLLQEHLPRVHAHFTLLEFSPEYYLIEWIFTLYTRTFPLDVACRVWDLFCRDGDCFLFRTALGILRLFQTEIMERHTIEEVGQFLGHLPETIDSDVLFQHIAAVNLTAKKFAQCLQQHISV